MRKRRPVAERFWEKVNKSKECWEWTSAIDYGGYGIFTMPGHKSAYAHRLSYQFSIGKITKGLCVCHHCDNRRCVRPDHLFLGTYKDNYADMKFKNRHRPSHGSRHRLAKFTEKEIKIIRIRVKNGEIQRAIAKEYGVNPTTIWQIIHRTSWKHI